MGHNNTCIRNVDAYVKGIWPDQLFKGLLPRGITPTNVDALYEINSHFLAFERKPHDFELKPSAWGQIGALSKMADASGSAFVFVQVCMLPPEKGDHPTSLLIHRLHRTAIPTTLEAVQTLIQAWGTHANTCRAGRDCMDVSWLPDSVRCVAAAVVASKPTADEQPQPKQAANDDIPF